MNQIIFIVQNLILTTKKKKKTLFKEVLDSHLQTSNEYQENALKTPINEVKFYSRKDTAEILGITLATLHKYTKQGIVKSHRIGRRVLYKLADIENALTSRKF